MLLLARYARSAANTNFYRIRVSGGRALLTFGGPLLFGFNKKVKNYR